MGEFSATHPAGSPVQACMHTCEEAWGEVMAEVNEIASPTDPLERNVAITKAYRDLAARDPDNHWVRLAGYVSTQGGCAMQETQTRLARSLGRMFFSPDKAYASLGEANKTIFTSVFPPNLMVANHGYDKFKECVDSGEIQVEQTLVDAMGKKARGDFQGAADMLAEHEQVKIVQPIYDKYAGTFSGMAWADWTAFWADKTSIPIAYSCTRDNLVTLDGDLSNPQHRVVYYKKLLREMLKLEGG